MTQQAANHSVSIVQWRRSRRIWLVDSGDCARTASKVKRVVPLFFLALFISFTALADGGVYIHKTALAANVTIPDQRALLCWSNGTERLAIDTRFVGEGTNFAWVVPLPSQPKIEEATTGLFNTLDYIFRAPIVHEVFPLFSVLLFGTGVGYLLLSVRRNTEPTAADLIVSLVTAAAIWPVSAGLAIVLAVLLLIVVFQVRSGGGGCLSIFVGLFFLFLLSSMLLPALMTAGSRAVPTDEVTVLERNTIGAYDTATLTSKKPHALVDWLKQNDYVTPAGIETAVSNYVQRGWVFVATRLHRDSAGRTSSSPQPLCFTFHAEKPVYPMQLTGIGNTNLDVELFVFGPSRAEASNFHVERCARPGSDYDSGRFPNVRIVHPLLSKWTAGSHVATHLMAKLTPEQMKNDIELQWAPFSEFHRTVYSRHAAAFLSLNWGVGVFCLCLLVGSLVVAFKREQRSSMLMVTGFAIIVGIAAAALEFGSLPKTEVRIVRLRRALWRQSLLKVQYKYIDEVGTNASLANARAAAAKIAATETNILSGVPIREEDSPGNYLLAEGTNDVDFILFDADGGAHTNW